jgi:CBS domain containing-hemolysin-like protein
VFCITHRRTPAAAAEASAAPRGFGSLDLSRPLSGAKIIRPVLFVPPSMPALDLLLKMQATRTHMALVIDEYGGTDGLASIEDIVETIVGDIEDEHDESDAPSLVRAPDDSFIVDARASLEDVSEAVGVPLADIADSEEIDTVGGLITTLAGRVPVRGEIIGGPHELEFEVLDADPRRVKRLRLRRGRSEPVPPAPRRPRPAEVAGPKEAKEAPATKEAQKPETASAPAQTPQPDGGPST